MTNKKRAGNPRKVRYTVYEAYLDRLVVIGSARECAAYLGCSVNSFQPMVSKVKSGRNRAYCVVVEDLDSGTYTVYGGNNTGELRGRPQTVDDSLADKLYAAGLSDAAMAKSLGVDTRTVWTWRKRTNFPQMQNGGARERMWHDGSKADYSRNTAKP